VIAIEMTSVVSSERRSPLELSDRSKFQVMGIV
jgi:hypothetical protein